jgi:hypothetical protein
MSLKFFRNSQGHVSFVYRRLVINRHRARKLSSRPERPVFSCGVCVPARVVEGPWQDLELSKIEPSATT